MNTIQIKTISVFALLATLMAATRFSHFGSAVSLPDASLAIFLLGGMYLSRSSRWAIVAFSVLIMEAGTIDYYATSVLGVSDWCMTPAYWLLLPVYGSLWLVGRWFVLRHTLQGKGMLIFSVVAWVACSFAFIASNAAFYLFSEHFAAMSVAEYISRVTQYYSSYVSVALLYVACAVALHMLFNILGNQSSKSHSEAA